MNITKKMVEARIISLIKPEIFKTEWKDTRIAQHTNFYLDLGLDEMFVATLVTKIATAYQVSIPQDAHFKTVGQLADHITILTRSEKS